MDSYSGKLGGRKQQRGDLRDVVEEGGSIVEWFFLSDPSPAVRRHREGGARRESVLPDKFYAPCSLCGQQL